MVLSYNLESANDELALKVGVVNLHRFDASIEDLHFFSSLKSFSIAVKHESDDMSKLDYVNVLFNTKFKDSHNDLL